MVSKRVSTNEDSHGKEIVPQILQFHAEPESTSQSFSRSAPFKKIVGQVSEVVPTELAET
jgi:hypothetical protein